MSRIEITYKPLEDEIILEVQSMLERQDIYPLYKGEKKGFAAFYGRAAVGVLLYALQGRYLVVDRIEVSAQYQRLGVGTGMLEMLAAFAKAKKYEIFFSFLGDSKQDPFYRFVASTGMFHIEKQKGYDIVLEPEELRNLCNKYPCVKGEKVSFFEQNRKMQDAFLEQMALGYPEIAEEIRSGNKEYRRELCCCAVSRGQIQAACFIKGYDSWMELKLLYALPQKGILAAKALFQTLTLLDQDHLVPMHLTTTGEIAVKILDGLCSSYRVKKQIYMAYYIGKWKDRR